MQSTRRRSKINGKKSRLRRRLHRLRPHGGILVMANRQGKQGQIPQSSAFQSVIDFMQVYIANNPGRLENILADAAWTIAEIGRQHHLDVEWALWRRIASLNRPSELG